MFDSTYAYVSACLWLLLVEMFEAILEVRYGGRVCQQLT